MRWLWLPNADAEHVAASTVAEFRYVLHLNERPLRANLHVVSRGAFVASVNGKETGNHTEWSAFDWEEITPELRFGAGAAGDNEVLVRVVSPQLHEPATSAPAACAATIHLTDLNGTERRIVSDDAWSARPGDSGAWSAAQEVGPLNAAFSVGIDRAEAIAGPDRIVTDASLLRKDFPVAAYRSARLTVTALGAYRAWLNGKPVAPQTLLSPGFTDFHKRVLYQTYDVTSMLRNCEKHAGLHAGRWMAWLAADVERHPLLSRTRSSSCATGHHVRERAAGDDRHRRHMADGGCACALVRDLRRRGLRCAC